ncbi:glycosyltransferase family 2 protein [Acinetobacter nectaris]|uniref:glycosyltransferase family 2 protein n=1 Tax=Acinetobacter nectaris TaxID=1219382 RepID=UPI001F4194D6|nr:glycosyltransferase family 2 protein [Acinetobacter nectaris]MCF9045710.1 glycosyltransferase family 2 protein [Acinetobacter nectaris]
MIVAIIVIYEPKYLEFIENLYAILSQVDKVIIVDNSTNSINYKFNSDKVIYSFLNGNKGIAEAQNIGISIAEKEKPEFIIFFDQDSSIPKGFINNLLDDYTSIKNSGTNIGLIGPRFIDSRYDFFYKTIDYSTGKRKKIDVSNIDQPVRSTLLISSGSLCSLNSIKNVGLMRKEYFIDYVDTEWCFRFESMGYQNYISSKAIMSHSVGDKIIEFKLFNTPIHSPFRRYFVTRNAFYMFKEKHIPKIVPIRQFFVNFIQQMIILFGSKNKISYLKSYLKGFKDGLRYLIK